MTTDPHALAAAYALDALSAEERELFRRHLADCPSCQLEAAEFAATAARLGAAAAQAPPAQLRAAVLDRVAVTRQSPPLTRPTRLRGRLRSSATWLVAAAVLLVAVAAGFVASQHERATQLADREQQVAAVLAAPDAQFRRDRVGAEGRLTVVASRALDQAVVLVADLPALQAGRTYQMWLVTAGSPRSVGTIDEADQVRTLVVRGLDGARAVAMTVEPDGGSKKPTSPVIATAALT